MAQAIKTFGINNLVHSTASEVLYQVIYYTCAQDGLDTATLRW